LSDDDFDVLANDAVRGACASSPRHAATIRRCCCAAMPSARGRADTSAAAVIALARGVLGKNADEPIGSKLGPCYALLPMRSFWESR